MRRKSIVMDRGEITNNFGPYRRKIDIDRGKSHVTSPESRSLQDDTFRLRGVADYVRYPCILPPM